MTTLGRRGRDTAASGPAILGRRAASGFRREPIRASTLEQPGERLNSDRENPLNILTNIVTAEEDDLAAIGESLRPVDDWNGIERRGIDTAKIATLHCLLTGDEFEQALSLYEPVYASIEDALVLRLADEVTEKLAELDEDALERVAEELAATEEFELEQWDADEVQDMVMALAELAQLATSRGQPLFVWMHPLLT